MESSLQTLGQISPIFLALLLGFFLRRLVFQDEAAWETMNGLAYWVLFPMLLFDSILRATLDFQAIASYLMVISLAFITTFFVVIALCGWLKFPLPICNSTVQGAARHNSFMALAICGVWLGEAGFAIATLATAFQVVVTNFCVMGYISSFTSKGDGPTRWLRILTNQIRNPFLLSIGLALCLKWGDIQYLPVLSETAGLIGRSALPLSLLATGAGLSFQCQRKDIAPIAIGVTAKMLLFPLLVVAGSLIFPLEPAYFLVAIVYGAVPTAASSYVVARLTGGDAPLLATMTMIQLTLSFASFFLISWFVVPSVLVL